MLSMLNDLYTRAKLGCQTKVEPNNYNNDLVYLVHQLSKTYKGNTCLAQDSMSPLLADNFHPTTSGFLNPQT